MQMIHDLFLLFFGGAWELLLFFVKGGGSVEYVNNLEGIPLYRFNFRKAKLKKKGGREMAARISSEPAELAEF